MTADRIAHCSLLLLLSPAAVLCVYCPTREELRAQISGHAVFPYTASTFDTWDLIKEADQDTSNLTNVILIYSEMSTDAEQEYNSGNGWTREHLWPQSLMEAHADENDAPATDVHALVAAHGPCNSKRNNNRFGKVDWEPADELCGLACDASAEVCEPADRVKGQAARALLYMAIRYDGFDDLGTGQVEKWADLVLSDVSSSVDTILDWNRNFPPTAFELTHNDVVERHQGVRNPFIDDPDLADCFKFDEERRVYDDTAAPAWDALFINELHYDNSGGDEQEGIEIAGPAGISLDGVKVYYYNGGNSKVYKTKELAGNIPDQQAGMGVLAFEHSSLQNGAPDAVALVDPKGVVIQFLSYEGKVVASGGPAHDLGSVDIGVAESSKTPVGYSLQLQGTGSRSEDFWWKPPAKATFGAINADQTFISCCERRRRAAETRRLLFSSSPTPTSRSSYSSDVLIQVGCGC